MIEYSTILADPPWRFANKSGKGAPEHRRLNQYRTMSAEELKSYSIPAAANAHLYLWCPNALLIEGVDLMRAWGFNHKTVIVWHKIRKDGGSDGRGMGFYFRNVTEMVLFGVRGRLRTLAPARRQVNVIESRKRGHSVKPNELYDVIETCSPGPYLELFARRRRDGWDQVGDQLM